MFFLFAWFDCGILTAQDCDALQAAVAEMVVFSSPAEFSAAPVVLSEPARKSQEPLLAAGREVVQQACALVTTAKSLIASPKDAGQWQALAGNSKAVSDSMKGLVRTLMHSDSERSGRCATGPRGSRSAMPPRLR